MCFWYPKTGLSGRNPRPSQRGWHAYFCTDKATSGEEARRASLNPPRPGGEPLDPKTAMHPLLSWRPCVLFP